MTGDEGDMTGDEGHLGVQCVVGAEGTCIAKDDVARSCIVLDSGLALEVEVVAHLM